MNLCRDRQLLQPSVADYYDTPKICVRPGGPIMSRCCHAPQNDLFSASS